MESPFENTNEQEGLLLMVGNTLHAGPGNPVTNTERQAQLFCVTGEVPFHYTGANQLFWDSIIENKHGSLCFWALLHVTEFALCY